MIESPLQRRAPLPPQLTRRVGVLGVLAFVLFAIIAFRLWYLQVLTGTQNVAMATANVVRDIPIPAPRGQILDTNGAVLATYRVAPQVAIVADDLPPPGPRAGSSTAASPACSASAGARSARPSTTSRSRRRATRRRHQGRRRELRALLPRAHKRCSPA